MYNFNYAAHYKTDAEKTDYFMERDGAHPNRSYFNLNIF